LVPENEIGAAALGEVGDSNYWMLKSALLHESLCLACLEEVLKNLKLLSFVSIGVHPLYLPHFASSSS
jgi:hypothetical protein